MKKLSVNYVLYFLMLATIISACKKNTIDPLEYNTDFTLPLAKIANCSPGMPASVNFKIDGIKINGGLIPYMGTTSTSTTTAVFPGNIRTGLTSDYITIAKTGELVVSVPNLATPNDSLVMLRSQLATLALVERNYHSLVLADTGVSRTIFRVYDDNMAWADSGFNKIRLINAIPNSVALDFIRIDSVSTTSVTRDTIARNIAYRSASTFITNRFVSGSGFRWRVVQSGTGLVIANYSSVLVAPNRRVLTMYAHGFRGGTGAFVPVLSDIVINN
jgi:hypothetical protein